MGIWRGLGGLWEGSARRICARSGKDLPGSNLRGICERSERSLGQVGKGLRGIQERVWERSGKGSGRSLRVRLGGVCEGSGSDLGRVCEKSRKRYGRGLEEGLKGVKEEGLGAAWERSGRGLRGVWETSARSPGKGLGGVCQKVWD